MITLTDYDEGRFDTLDRLSCMYYGKQMYFLNSVGTVYSRETCRYLSLEDAIREFELKLEGDFL